MFRFIDCLLIERSELKNKLEYWNEFMPGDNTGKMLKAKILSETKTRLKELRNAKSSIFLDETSLSRVYQHVEGNPNSSWGVVSAQRMVLPKQENEARTERLKKEIRRRGYGFFEMEGHWLECQDPNVPYSKCPEDKLVDAVERSFFVPNISQQEVKELGDMFEQDAVLYGGPDTQKRAQALHRSGEVYDLGRFTPNTIAQGYSRLKNGKPYTFVDKPKQEPSARSEPPVDRDTRRSELKSMFRHRILNPLTQKQILVSTALQYDKNHPARKAAIAYLLKKKS